MNILLAVTTLLWLGHGIASLPTKPSEDDRHPDEAGKFLSSASLTTTPKKVITKTITCPQYPPPAYYPAPNPYYPGPQGGALPNNIPPNNGVVPLGPGGANNGNGNFVGNGYNPYPGYPGYPGYQGYPGYGYPNGYPYQNYPYYPYPGYPGYRNGDGQAGGTFGNGNNGQVYINGSSLHTGENGTPGNGNGGTINVGNGIGGLGGPGNGIGVQQKPFAQNVIRSGDALHANNYFGGNLNSPQMPFYPQQQFSSPPAPFYPQQQVPQVPFGYSGPYQPQQGFGGLQAPLYQPQQPQLGFNTPQAPFYQQQQPPQLSLNSIQQPQPQFQPAPPPTLAREVESDKIEEISAEEEEDEDEEGSPRSLRRLFRPATSAPLKSRSDSEFVSEARAMVRTPEGKLSVLNAIKADIESEIGALQG